MMKMMIRKLVVVCIVLTLSKCARAHEQNGIAKMEEPTDKERELFAIALPPDDPKPAPTPDPTREPTRQPTRDPTKEPTRSPTASPTSRQTEEPTRSPTASPTRRETEEPTKSPTASPTRRQTEEPTSSPTASPTRQATDPPRETNEPTKSPTKQPTASPTLPAAPEVTQPPTKEPTKQPTAAPTASPTATPTASPTAEPSASPSAAPSTPEPSAAPSTPEPSAAPSVPPQRIEASGVMMSLMNVTPLDAKAQDYWSRVTEVHLANEVMNALKATNVQVDVEFVSQDPPLGSGKVNRALLRTLQEPRQEIEFNAYYAIHTDATLADVDSYLRGAFGSNFKRNLYLERLQEYGGSAFQNTTDVAVTVNMEDEPIQDLPTRPPKGDDSTTAPEGRRRNGVGIVVGVVILLLVVSILGVAFYVRFRGRGNPVVRQESNPTKDTGTKEEVLSDHQSSTDSESAMFSYNHDRRDEVHAFEAGSGHSGYSLTSSSNGGNDDGNTKGDSKIKSFKNFINIWNNTPAKEEEEDEKSVGNEEFTVEVQKGRKLGLVLDTADDGGSKVEGVKPLSPFVGYVQKGDQLLSVDGQDLTTSRADEVSRAISKASKNSSYTRVFVFSRPHE